MLVFYITCLLFVVVVLGALLRVVAGLDLLAAEVPGPGVPADRLDVVLGVGAAAADREDGAPRRLEARRRHHRADRLLVQPRRHRDLPDDGLAVHRQRHGQAARGRRADLAAAVHDRRLQGRRRRDRRRPGDPRGRPAVAPARPGRRRRADRRHRPVHVRGARAHQLRGQRRRHDAGRQLDRRDRPRAADRVFAGDDPFDEATMLDDELAPQHADRSPGRHELLGERRTAHPVRAARTCPTPGRSTNRRSSPAPPPPQSNTACDEVARRPAKSTSHEPPTYDLVQEADGVVARVRARGTPFFPARRSTAARRSP